MLKGYVDTVSDEIDQAAMVDGASLLRICLLISHFSISKLSSLVPIYHNGSNKWLLEFKNEDKNHSFVMNGKIARQRRQSFF